jgi:hypothetical protein
MTAWPKPISDALVDRQRDYLAQHESAVTRGLRVALRAFPVEQSESQKSGVPRRTPEATSVAVSAKAAG